MRNLCSLEGEEHPPVFEVNANRHLGLAFVCAIAQPNKPADRLLWVKKVEVHTFVEVRLRPQFVGVVVFSNNASDNFGHGGCLREVSEMGVRV